MVIAHNISALNTFKSLNIAAKNSNKSMEKLSSGSKINRAGDDAAGLSISEKMRAQIRGLNQASTNAEHGVSMIQTAEGALNEEHSILQRMRELAVQSATDTNAEEDRDALQGELEQLTDEINRIGNTTEFNGMKILNGDKARKFTGGVSNAIEFKFDGGTAVTPGTKGEYTLDLSSASDGSTLKIDGVDVTLDTTDDASIASSFGDPALTAKYNITTSSGVVTFKEVAPSGNGGPVATNSDDTPYAKTVQTVKASIADTPGTNMEAAKNFVDNFDVKGYTAEIDATDKSKVIITSTEKYGTQDEVDAEMAVMKNKFSSITGKSNAGGMISASAAVESTLGVKGSEVDDSVYFHVGANSNQVINASFNDMRAKALGISFDTKTAGETTDTKTINDGTRTEAEEYALSIETRESANNTIEILDKAIRKVSEERSKYGAIQNRLEYTMNNLNTTSENMTAAESSIRDVDMADEMMSLTKSNILQQAAQSMLVQANQRPQQALQLLQ